MRTHRTSRSSRSIGPALALVATLLVVTGCDSAPPVAETPVSGPTAASVTTRGLVTVLDTGGGPPELCLGPVAESLPPQCTGPEIDGWHWSDHRGAYQTRGDTRWGQFAVTGTWDGSRLGYRSAVAAAVYDPMLEPSTPYPTPSVRHTRAELQGIARDVRAVPGAQDASASRGQVRLEVAYDDGTLQRRLDRRYGAGVVVVGSALVDSGS